MKIEASQQRIYTFDCTSDGELWNRFAHNPNANKTEFCLSDFGVAPAFISETL